MTEDLVHIRCLTCGKILANKWNTYQEMLSNGYQPGEAMTELGLTRYCCRARMMSPFKVIINVDRQEIHDTREKENKDELKDVLSVVDTGNNNNNNILESINPITTSIYGVTIVPEDPVAGIILPNIPTIDLPTIQPGGQILPEDEIIISRTYQAW